MPWRCLGMEFGGKRQRHTALAGWEGTANRAWTFPSGCWKRVDFLPCLLFPLTLPHDFRIAAGTGSG
jgi:hypothetical protein